MVQGLGDQGYHGGCLKKESAARFAKSKGTLVAP